MSGLEITNETPVSFLTVGQLKTILNLNGKPEIIETKQNDFSSDGKEYCFGLAGLAKLLNCSIPTAQALKASGKISFMQTGRKLVFEKNQVLKELSVSKTNLK